MWWLAISLAHAQDPAIGVLKVCVVDDEMELPIAAVTLAFTGPVGEASTTTTDPGGCALTVAHAGTWRVGVLTMEARRCTGPAAPHGKRTL